MSESIHWAHIDGTGKVVSWGTSHGDDVFRQRLEPGLVAVTRPEDVTHLSGHTYKNDEWVKSDP